VAQAEADVSPARAQRYAELLGRLLLGERAVVLLDRLTEAGGDFVRTGQRERFVPAVDLPTQVELELLQTFECRLLQFLERLRVGVRGLVLALPKVAHRALELLGVDPSGL